MSNNTEGFHHYHIRKRIHQKHEQFPHPDKFKRIFDKVIYVAVIVGPIMNLPQLFKIWVSQSASGVSFTSWISFSIISVFWFIYGILHKEKPVIFMNFALIIVQALIAIGALRYG